MRTSARFDIVWHLAKLKKKFAHVCYPFTISFHLIISTYLAELCRGDWEGAIIFWTFDPCLESGLKPVMFLFYQEARLRRIIDEQATEITDLKQDVTDLKQDVADQKEANVRMVRKVDELVQLFKAFL